MKKYFLTMVICFLFAANPARAVETISVLQIPNSPFWICTVSDGSSKNLYYNVVAAVDEYTAKYKCGLAYADFKRILENSKKTSGASSSGKASYPHTPGGHHGDYGEAPAILHYHTVGCPGCDNCGCGHGS